MYANVNFGRDSMNVPFAPGDPGSDEGAQRFRQARERGLALRRRFGKDRPDVLEDLG